MRCTVEARLLSSLLQRWPCLRWSWLERWCWNDAAVDRGRASWRSTRTSVPRSNTCRACRWTDTKTPPTATSKSTRQPQNRLPRKRKQQQTQILTCVLNYVLRRKKKKGVRLRREIHADEKQPSTFKGLRAKDWLEKYNNYAWICFWCIYPYNI